MIAVLLVVPFTMLPVLLYARNVRLFRPPPSLDTSRPDSSISVLIPARNEEGSIGACVTHVLKSVHVDLECIVLDDASNDATASIVRQIAATDSRVSLHTATSLPEGWSGKQHACFQLSKIATKPILTFLDADVRLHPEALARLLEFQRASGAALVSGFPRQETVSLLEKLLIPLMHFILLAFLPLARMRRRIDPSLGAGCGQWFLTPREAYEHVGGHAAIRSSFHDGVQLPRAYRRNGLATDLCDATDLATCRMYRSAGQVWNGLAKNAREGLGTSVGIWFWTLILALGQISPFIFANIVIVDVVDEYSGMRYYDPSEVNRTDTMTRWTALGLCVLLWLVRFDSARRFHQSRLGALVHPIGIMLLLCLQWYAAIRYWLGKPVGWKGRIQPKGTT